jgi:hydrogenase maturation protein HypF
MWLERLANGADSGDAYLFPFADSQLDFRPLLSRLIEDRLRGRDIHEIARAFQRGVASGLANAAIELCEAHETDTLVLSGGVFQNELLLADLKSLLQPTRLEIWTNHAVPANDGGISLGQAALAVFADASDYDRELQSDIEHSAPVTAVALEPNAGRQTRPA